MKIAFVLDRLIPTPEYGESERVLWWHTRQLSEAGWEPIILAQQGSECKHALTLPFRSDKPLAAQIPKEAALVHFFYHPTAQALQGMTKPYLITYFENAAKPCLLDANTVFLSAAHAAQHGGQVYVYPGLDPRDYGEIPVDWQRSYFHFLAETPLPGRNLRDAIAIAAQAKMRLHVIGSRRLSLMRRPYLSLSPYARFHAMMPRQGRIALISGSLGLIFPVVWHEPFGLPAIESLYLGCPIFGTPFGALPEIVCGKTSHLADTWKGRVDGCFSELGCLSVRKSELVDAIRHSADTFSPKRCREYAIEHFSAHRMSQQYWQLYEQVLDGQSLHPEPIRVEKPVAAKLHLEA